MRLWPTPPLRPCCFAPWFAAACVWCSHRWRSGWRSPRCRRMTPTSPCRSLGGRPFGTPAVRTRMRSCDAPPGFCGQRDRSVLTVKRTHNVRSYWQSLEHSTAADSDVLAESRHLASSCRRVFISQMGFVAVMAVNPKGFKGRQRFRHMHRHAGGHLIIIHITYSTLHRTLRKSFDVRGCWPQATSVPIETNRDQSQCRSRRKDKCMFLIAVYSIRKAFFFWDEVVSCWCTESPGH